MEAFKYTILLVTLLLTFGCTNPPDYPDEPVIEFLGMNVNTISQSDRQAVLEIFVSFTDGDGDVGAEPDTTDIGKVILVDSRDGAETSRAIPFVPEQGTGNGISGEITLRYLNDPFPFVCCISNLPPGIVPCTTPTPEFPEDSVTFSLYMVDRAGNVSNTVETTPLRILCN